MNDKERLIGQSLDDHYGDLSLEAEMADKEKNRFKVCVGCGRDKDGKPINMCLWKKEDKYFNCPKTGRFVKVHMGV